MNLITLIILTNLDFYTIILFTTTYLGDEEKSRRRSLAQRASTLVQGGAEENAEDGLGADELRRLLRPSGRSRYRARVLKGRHIVKSLRT